MSADSNTVVLIIGGGLGGLALAQLISQSSSSVKVLIFERDENEHVRDQGYCIGIDSTGFEVLTKIRALDHLLSDESGSWSTLSSFQILNQYLQELLALNVHGIKLIYREQLRRALLTNLDVQWNKRFVSYKVLDDGVEATFQDGTSVHGTILIGCDGARSLVRAQLIPGFQRTDLRIINTAGTVEQSDDMKKIRQLARDSLVRILGRQGHSMLILPFRQLWMWSLSWPEKEDHEERNTSPTQLVEKVRRHFDNEELVQLIERSTPSSYLSPFRMHSALCLKQNPFPNNPRVTLLGDAAHPMTTQAGKGANTAFADAFDLANLLLNPSSSSLSEYEQKMFKRGFAAVKMSLSNTKMIHMTGWSALLRNSIFSIIRYTMALINIITIPFRWCRKKHD
ncbi:unnamed protein product [Adineta ricciae]|uniref:FAD-binding domain-containing protein n=1 Tax=Adineta ricciae TaxID=249248 RepID=A0A813PI40_ADIRI|nr:unnamed protein product [Adineta ricciae]CAF1287165.1 unnamed protein product [Adineta ricciae]